MHTADTEKGDSPRVGALILAAGKGTRMYSDTPKVLKTILGEPMLRYVMDALAPFFGERVWTVIGHGARRVEAEFSGEDRRFVTQLEQKGTGHALVAAWPVLRAARLDYVVVVNGDTPLLGARELSALLEASHGTDVVCLTLTLAEPGAYGRIIRKNGRMAGIIEAKDYAPKLYGPETGEVNSGIYCLKLSSVEPLLTQISNANASNEYYITDLIGLAAAAGLSVVGVSMGDEPNLLGVNSPKELAATESLLRARIVGQWLTKGVMVHMAESVLIGPRAELEPGAELTGPCEVYGKSFIGRDVRVRSHTVLRDARVEAGTEIRSFSHIEGARIAPNCLVGPFARLRPGSVLEESAHVGNFVETKKVRLGKGAKVNHLTYLGDAEVGAAVNVGAGTITCNYDGVNKHQTIIGEHAFIGSNTALVAPVIVGAGALVGAGSVITKNVPDNSLAVTRAPQRTISRVKSAKPEKTE